MTILKNTLRTFVVLVSLIAARSSFAYPIYVKIENPRAHSLFLVSDSEKIEIEIPAGSSREFKVACASDWRVRYSSGAYGMVHWGLDKDLNYFTENSCKSCKICMGDNWNKKTVKYCILRLEELVVSFSSTTYTLEVVEIRDLDIACESDECKLSKNEQALKVIPSSKCCVLVTPEALVKAMILFGGTSSAALFGC